MQMTFKRRGLASGEGNASGILKLTLLTENDERALSHELNVASAVE